MFQSPAVLKLTTLIGPWFKVVHYIGPWSKVVHYIGLWSKVVHYTGNRGCYYHRALV